MFATPLCCASFCLNITLIINNSLPIFYSLVVRMFCVDDYAAK